MRILNFCGRSQEGRGQRSGLEAVRAAKERERRRGRTERRSGLPLRTRVRYSCFISFSRRDGRPGYMDEPPDRTTCLYSSWRTSTGAAWIVLNKSSAVRRGGESGSASRARAEE